jgi:hypothetical protein
MDSEIDSTTSFVPIAQQSSHGETIEENVEKSKESILSTNHIGGDSVHEILEETQEAIVNTPIIEDSSETIDLEKTSSK